MDLIEGESLLNFVKAHPDRKLEDINCKVIFKQIIEGIFYLHEKNIFHRDIKLENIIIKDKVDIKIIDFGFGTFSPRNKLLNFFCGTPSYMPPEIILKKDYLGEFADIWSIGILLYTILCGAFPFRGNKIFYYFDNFLN
jgi:serine/threonine protein kinase